MRVLLINRSYYPHIGGIENSLYYLSRELKHMGNNVTILTEEINEDYPNREEYANIITYPRYHFSKILLPLLPMVNKNKVSKWIRENKPRVDADLIICRDPMLGLSYLKVFPMANIVYIPAVVIKYYNRGIRKAQSIREYIKEVLRYSQLKIEERQQKNILESSQKVIVFSKNVRKQLLDGNLCKKEKITVCHPGVADKFFYQAPEKTIDDSVIRFIYVGRLVAEKNLGMLIDAFSQLQCNNKRLILVGNGNQRSNLERQVRELSLIDNVVFVGESNTPETYFKESHFFIIPSSYESFGQVIIEALSSGTPVIGFSSIEGKTLTAVDELIIDGETGFICKEFCSDSLRDNMERAVKVIYSGKEYYHMRESAMKFTKDNCSWSNLIENCMR